LESISPAELARTLLDDCLAGREPDAAAVGQLAGLALDSDEATALSASRALLGTLVEGLADRFEPALCAAYAHLFAPVITRALPGLDGAALTARYESCAASARPRSNRRRSSCCRVSRWAPTSPSPAF